MLNINVDMRLFLRGVVGATPRGYGIFVYNQLPPRGLLLSPLQHHRQAYLKRVLRKEGTNIMHLRAHLCSSL